jgi:uncharacterized membrane-anchored protein YjiN (DUF445 family)
MTVPARIAWTLIALALVVWSASWYFPQQDWLTIVQHGLAGMFIGGICDWYAIRKVYVKIEQNHQALAAGVSEAVVRDMIQPEQTVSALQARLADPAFRQELASQVASHIPNRESLTHFLDEVWRESLRSHVVAWLVRLDPRDQLQSARAPNVLDNAQVRQGLHKVLAMTVAREDLATELYDALIERYGRHVVWEPRLPGIKAVTMERVLRRLLSPGDLVRILGRAVHRAFDDTEGQGAANSRALDAAARSYGEAYVEAWHDWPEEERQVASAALVDRLAPELMEALIEAVWSQREELQALAARDFSIDSHPLVDFLEQRVGDLAREQLEQVDERSKRLLQEKLTKLGGAELRAMLERRTRPHLDWIQVNGTTLGAVLGLLVGVAAHFIGGRN